jgi:hypothetical protein
MAEGRELPEAGDVADAALTVHERRELLEERS